MCSIVRAFVAHRNQVMARAAASRLRGLDELVVDHPDFSHFERGAERLTTSREES
ncbi:hypothetical protein [Halomarina ordinaria]|uniref:Uncharacterized protein n=1 Tax=Halomarina ordinaria TaxID=3033939 RepID=A0ABD5UCU3_9EURY|nr:hypothetical protein [Halomarina sp. PSRA2]